MGKKEGWITTEDYAKYELNQPILNLPGLSVEQLQEARKWAYREFYLRPSYILKRLRKIKSLGDLVTNYRQARDFHFELDFASLPLKKPLFQRFPEFRASKISATH